MAAAAAEQEPDIAAEAAAEEGKAHFLRGSFVCSFGGSSNGWAAVPAQCPLDGWLLLYLLALARNPSMCVFIKTTHPHTSTGDFPAAIAAWTRALGLLPPSSSSSSSASIAAAAALRARCLANRSVRPAVDRGRPMVRCTGKGDPPPNLNPTTPSTRHPGPRRGCSCVTTGRPRPTAQGASGSTPITPRSCCGGPR